MSHFILGVHITDRLTEAATVQRLLTEYGSHIKTRLGLHEIEPGSTSPQGVVILELVGDRAACETLATRLNEIPGVEVQKMVFSHSPAVH